MSTTVPRLTKLAQDNSRTTWWLSYYPPRLLTLFLLGSLTSFVIDHLLTQNHITEYPNDITKLIDTAAWIPPTCGLSAILVGSMFPLADYWFMRKPQEFQKEWSNVMRCMGGFIGVAYAATCILYSSCVCFGTLGRQLMIVPEDWYDRIDQNKNHEITGLTPAKGE
ncbi:2520_t:CDS:2 [Cetraspora pellucida]|uniref:2520_t:CDS:1 n=1 Tax=Cetraspora pellucida TaxID=1433469 RepID=A0A9N8ZYN5_9GLOM|nr:2520_t:CDS:2 [Cetraspora pellucida]